jgi:hypothetical protein
MAQGVAGAEPEDEPPGRRDRAEGVPPRGDHVQFAGFSREF